MISSSTESRGLVEVPDTQVQSYGWQNGLTKGILKVVSFLHDPICYSSSAVHRIISPLPQNSRKTCCEKSGEITVRVLYSGSLLLSVPIGLVTGALGMPLRCLASAVKEEHYCYEAGNGTEKELDDAFSLMTWNICGTEGGMSTSTGGMVHWKKRIDPIVRMISEKDPDVLALQEVQSVDFARALFHKLKDRYPHCYYNLGIHPLKSASGIVVFSKFASTFSFTPFDDAAGWAKGENKGVATMVIADKVRICLTHLQWGGERSEEYVRVRERQLQQIIGIIKSTGHRAILAGDLNLDRNGEEFKKSSLSSRFTVHNQNSPTWTSYFIRRVWKGQANPRRIEKSIDYIATPKVDDEEHKLQIETEKVEAYRTEVPVGGVSDHHALLARIKL